MITVGGVNQASEEMNRAAPFSRLRRHRHLAKYFIIGSTASAIDVALFLILFNLIGSTPLVAHSVSVPVAVLFSFYLNSRHNFHTRDHAAVRLISFTVVCLIGYFAGYGVISVVQAMGLGANIGKIISLPVVFVLQYALNSRITFRQIRPKAALRDTSQDSSDTPLGRKFIESESTITTERRRGPT